jgi:hypothetical protein
MSSKRSSSASSLPLATAAALALRKRKGSRNHYTMVLPYSLAMLTLTGSAVRDILGVRDNNMIIYRQEAQQDPLLAIVGKQAQGLDEVKADLVKLAKTDPQAALILNEFFPAPAKAAVPAAVPTPTLPSTFKPSVTDRLPPTDNAPAPTTISDRLPPPSDAAPAPWMSDRLPPPETSFPSAQPPEK